MKAITFIFTFLVLAFTSHGQIKFYEGDFKTPISDVKSLEFTSEKGIAITIPIDATFKKYDRVYMNFEYRLADDYEGPKKDNWKEGEWISCGGANQYYYEPKSATFKDNHGGDRYLKLYLVKHENFTDFSHIFYGGWFREHFTEYKFRIVLNGYFADGTVTEWDDYSESFKTRTKYKFSKTYLNSGDILFVHDEIYVKEQANKKLAEETKEYEKHMDNARSYLMEYDDAGNGYMSYDRWNSIKYYLEKASKYVHVDSTGYNLLQDFEQMKSLHSDVCSKYDIPFVPTKNFVLEAYLTARTHQIKNNEYDKLKETQNKLLQIKKDKKHKTLKEKLVDVEDAEKIIQIIMEH